MIQQEKFGFTGQKEVYLFRMQNNNGDTLSITNYGGIITSWTALDKQGNRKSITAGFHKLESYLPNEPNFGAIIGRYANRIAGAQFTLNDHLYTLSKNEGNNQLHGGHDNFTKVVWHANIDTEKDRLILIHESKDGNEGFPGNLIVRVSFHLSDDNELTIHYKASTDQDTHINLTYHPYFNLSGDFSTDILNHDLTIHAHAYTPVNAEGIPTGLIAPVTGTAYDFTEPKTIGRHRKEVDGYDTNFVLNNDGNTISHAATLADPVTGRTLDVYTDQPGLQLYTSNSLDGTIKTDDGIPLKKYAAVCLETQHFPDTPNHPNFPATLLKPGAAFSSITKYKAGIIK
jgi:aldose 1-epimerase